MAGLGTALAFIAGGAAEGVGKGLVEEAKAAREAAHREAERKFQVERDQTNHKQAIEREGISHGNATSRIKLSDDLAGKREQERFDREAPYRSPQEITDDSGNILQRRRSDEDYRPAKREDGTPIKKATDRESPEAFGRRAYIDMQTKLTTANKDSLTPLSSEEIERRAREAGTAARKWAEEQKAGVPSPADKPAEAPKKGAGTFADPVRVASEKEIEDLAPGTVFLPPGGGKPKQVPRTGTAAADKPAPRATEAKAEPPTEKGPIVKLLDDVASIPGRAVDRARADKGIDRVSSDQRMEYRKVRDSDPEIKRIREQLRKDPDNPDLRRKLRERDAEIRARVEQAP